MTNFRILRYLANTAKNVDKFKNTKLFAIQHLFEDTLEWLEVLKECGMEIDVVIGIEYSAKKHIVESLRDKGFRTVVPPFERMRETVKELLSESLKRCESENKRVIIAEVGGYAVPTLHQELEKLAKYCVGAVEETKHGLWEDRRITNLKIPIFQVAETRLKKLENYQVGEAVVEAIERVLRTRGLSFLGKNICVIGFGWIGSAIARSLKSRNVIVSCYDSDPIKNAEAHFSGYIIGPKQRLLKKADVIIGATGHASLTRDDIKSLKNEAYVVSASSKEVEIKLDEIKDLIAREDHVDEHVIQYILKGGKSFYLIGKGFPINFILERSVSGEVMDMIFSDVFLCIIKLLKNDYKPGIYAPSDEEERKIAELWTQLYYEEI